MLADPRDGEPEAIRIATGSEVQVALEGWERLLDQGIGTRVVSMPSWELFEAQPQEYRDSVLPPVLRARVAIEAGSPLGWLRYVTEDGETITIDHFGASAPGSDLFREFGFTSDAVVEAVHRVLGRHDVD